MVAVGVDNHRVAVIPAHGSVFDDPRDTPFNEIWNEPYLREACLCNHSMLLSKTNDLRTGDESWKIVRQSI